MLRDAHGLEDEAVVKADVYIAGAGAAGITLARELREGGLDVVLLESGDLTQSLETQALYDGSVPRDGLAASLP